MPSQKMETDSVATSAVTYLKREELLPDCTAVRMVPGTTPMFGGPYLSSGITMLPFRLPECRIQPSACTMKRAPHGAADSDDDEQYRLKRNRNNEAARKSRVKKRIHTEYVEYLVKQLSSENSQLRSRIVELEGTVTRLASEHQTANERQTINKRRTANERQTASERQEINKQQTFNDRQTANERQTANVLGL
ncbi:PREDICTED: CCAAT/enhancer-binding protein gamma-like [Priapulus caudatus]|uniref:CCAAT/enhancer-binding protein gamma-like n=1 Tax=Priapulus caudatus TaxID=37621 RepID=A0ABM1ED21_PRICU|nr:PREDICTED: CCAAT/enhancer-binding protein gamma-like [Priapulus caudatus]